MEISGHIRISIWRSLLALLLVGVCLSIFAQPAGKCEFRNNEFVIEINKSAGNDQLNDFIAKYDLKELDLNTAFKTNNLTTLKNLGWKVLTNDVKMLVITKPLSGSSNLNNPVGDVIFSENELSIAQRFPATGNGLLYGYNKFKNNDPFKEKDSIITFYLHNHLEANKVMLAGSFNNFSPDNLRMKRTSDGWAASVKLSPGKYWYKFITDGNWMVDENNSLRENDGLGNVNSVYYKSNYLFKLNGHSTAEKVYITGNFNNWRKNQLAMQKTETGWTLPVYLANGTHTYKYIVDNVYYLDINQLEKMPDGNGGYNGIIRLGLLHTFMLTGFANARQITVTGTFNNWRDNELMMKKTATGWELSYTLGPGNYQYKFIVDGNRILDPANQQTATIHRQTNSYLTIGASYTFRLKGVAKAGSVFLAGDFNDWEPEALPMIKKGDEWIYTLHLTTGKHKYKFIVDGNWITDPNNKTWEQNEYGTGNSVIWIDK